MYYPVIDDRDIETAIRLFLAKHYNGKRCTEERMAEMERDTILLIHSYRTYYNENKVH